MAPPYSKHIGPESISHEGPVTVLLGRHGHAAGAIAAPSPINYFSVKLKAGESWRFQPPAGHAVAWAAISIGSLLTPDRIEAGELVVFEENERPIDFVAVQGTEFVFGSAAKHPHDLVLGYYSVHTSHTALQIGETRIREVGDGLRGQGRL